jgi:UPF0042 nucleotide-binding protein
MNFLFLTGISGAGRTQASKFLEDLGYFCIDNIPAPLLPKLRELYLEGDVGLEKIAVVIDIRNAAFYNDFIDFVKKIKERDMVNVKVLYLDCCDEKILNRYKELKRIHPLAKGGIDSKTALAKEREALKPILEISDYVIDTSKLSIWDLKKELKDLFGENNGDKGLKVEVVSFGFKYGVPDECDIVFDVRFMPNPYYIESLKKMTGLQQEVRDYVLTDKCASEFIEKFFDMMKMLLPCYREEGKELLVIGIGCTGGQHRSVAISEEIGKKISSLGYNVSISHREQKKWG